MADLPLHKVNWFSIEAFVERYAAETRSRPGIIERELRLFAFKLGQDQPANVRLRELPDLTELPASDQLPPFETQLKRQALIEFCAKQGWPEPQFWNQQVSEGRRRAGRPSDRDAILQELDR